MRLRTLIWILGAMVGVILLTGCRAGGQQTAGASAAIEAYLQARVQSDIDQMTLLSCPDWEAQARVEAISFQSMKAQLDGVTCRENGSDGGFTLVTCQGKIVTSYQGETREWSVADHPYKVIEQDGEWRMCGYGQ